MSQSFLDDLKENGLPQWLYTWKAVGIIAVGGPIAVMLIGTMLSSITGGLASLLPADESAPACHLSNRDPIGPPRKDFNFNDSRIGEMEAARSKAVEKFQTAAESCRPGACSSAARQEFRKAARIYIDARARAQEMMLSWYGDDGLRPATITYSENVDDLIVTAIRDRYAAGLFDLDNLRGIEAATRMLLFRPIAEFTPCRAK